MNSSDNKALAKAEVQDWPSTRFQDESKTARKAKLKNNCQ